MNLFDIVKYEDAKVYTRVNNFTPFFVISEFKKGDCDLLVVCPNLYHATNLYEEIHEIMDEVYLYPVDEFVSSIMLATSKEFKQVRQVTTRQLFNSQKKIVITTLNGYLRKIPLLEIYEKYNFSISKNSNYSYESLVNTLYEAGYEIVSLVRNVGEFSKHGNIIDIWPLGLKNPVRLDFFGDEIEDIRFFDFDTQLKISSTDIVNIYPNLEFLGSDLDQKIKNIPFKNKEFLDEQILNNKDDYFHLYSLFYETARITDYFNPVVIFDSLQRLNISNLQLNEHLIEFKKNYFESNIKYMPFHNFYVNDEIILDDLNSDGIDLKINNIDNFKNDFSKILKYLKKNIVIATNNNQIVEYLKDNDLSYVKTTLNNINEDVINIIDLHTTFSFESENLVYLSENVFFEKSRIKKRKKYHYQETLNSYEELKIGDYIVHEDHGVGSYEGIVTLKQNSVLKDFVHINYKGQDKLYVPIDKMYLINKYVAYDGFKPKIHSLSSGEWQRKKLKIQSKLSELKEKLTELYAQRKQKIGIPMIADNEFMKSFEEAFEYQLTSDQIKAIKKIKDEMEKPYPMDALLCGDVGFGKTEVAFCAAMKAIISGYQVLILCPTTILSMQHYENALFRFSNQGVNINLINRFVKNSNRNQSIKSFNEGKIDILIGTHSLLSNDIVGRNIGLLIIDEEQRFGVTHKEKIQTLRSKIDVLVLSATPIPRTLQMALSGLRTLVELKTPPLDRYPIQTYVCEENEYLIIEAVQRELARKGQVFILYNKVKSIEKIKKNIEKIVPNSRISIAHGQMDKNQLEDTMHDFSNHEIDVLICTTIIETGIDIPNVNTLIVLGADVLGLSQLYQIRGRVGRSDKIAFAYLMYKPAKILTESAVKRLESIREFTELGSGFKIAMRDLSIRGAGDILGSEQAGFINDIGLNMYMQLFEEKNNEIKPSLNFATPAYIPEDYINSESLKIEIHQKIQKIMDIKDVFMIRQELVDRFGIIPSDMNILIERSLFDYFTKIFGISKINTYRRYVEIIMSSNNIDGLILFNVINKFKNIKIINDNKNIKFIVNLVEDHFIFDFNKMITLYMEEKNAN